MNKKNINKENKTIWDANAASWDEFMGEDGNNWHKELIAPETELLLNLNKDDRLLDIACGNGLFARRMSKKGIKVTAFDFSDSNIVNAKKHDCTNIDYQVLDATSDSDLKKLCSNKYDALVANMVFMDMPDLECLFSHVEELLTDKGVFVFSIQHPGFNSEYVKEKNGNLIVSDYINSNVSKGVAIPTQLKKQYYFHRPIFYYLNLGFTNKLVVNGYVEPVFTSEDNGVYSKIPPVLIVSMCKR